jgi:hypothetical protein
VLAQAIDREHFENVIHVTYKLQCQVLLEKAAKNILGRTSQQIAALPDTWIVSVHVFRGEY